MATPKETNFNTLLSLLTSSDKKIDHVIEKMEAHGAEINEIKTRLSVIEASSTHSEVKDLKDSIKTLRDEEIKDLKNELRLKEKLLSDLNNRLIVMETKGAQTNAIIAAVMSIVVSVITALVLGAI
jgi:tetrahydromethanopterin S-methyltransferase subunit B